MGFSKVPIPKIDWGPPVSMRVVYKIWLDNDGMAFGEGVYRLLDGIGKTGSLRRATCAMGMCYRKALRIIACCECNLGVALIERTIGGASGGGSRLTRHAKEIMEKYEKLRAEVEAVLAEAYTRHFDEKAGALHEVVVHTASLKGPCVF